MNIGTRIKEIRLLNNWKQKDMATELSMSTTGYASWEQGLSEPNTSQLTKLSSIFNVSVDYILGIEKEDGTHYIETPSYSPSEDRLVQNYRILDKSMQKLVEYYVQNLIDIEKERKSN